MTEDTGTIAPEKEDDAVFVATIQEALEDIKGYAAVALAAAQENGQATNPHTGLAVFAYGSEAVVVVQFVKNVPLAAIGTPASSAASLAQNIAATGLYLTGQAGHPLEVVAAEASDE